ncbi:MAG: glycosyltransferase, partial [Acidimicrobiales bacterium]
MISPRKGEEFILTDLRIGQEMSIVIPTHNRSAILTQTLERLRRATSVPGLEVVVVANACTDDTSSVVAAVGERSLPIRLVEEARPSASIARNVGAKAAHGALLVFLDDDILVEPGVLAAIAAWYDASDRRSLLVGQIRPLAEHLATPFGAFRQQALGQVSRQGSPEEVDWFASGLAAVPKASFVELDGYAENYPAAGLEDADFAIRARRAGHRIIFHPGVVGHHNDWAGTTARDFCRRAANHCSTGPLLAAGFPDNEHPWGQLVEVNRPALASDPRSIKLRKGMKAAALAVAADRWLPAVADTVTLPHRPRELLFKASVSLAMFGGYQRGLRLHAGRGVPDGVQASQHRKPDVEATHSGGAATTRVVGGGGGPAGGGPPPPPPAAAGGGARPPPPPPGRLVLDDGSVAVL